MARGLRRGPNLLRFRSLVDSIAGYVTGILDARQPSKVRYALRDCYLSALAMFYLICCAQHMRYNVALPVMLRWPRISLWSKDPDSINAT